DQAQVQLARVDLERRQLDFALVDVLARTAAGARKGRPPSSARRGGPPASPRRDKPRAASRPGPRHSRRGKRR
ncbi:MAG TPA: hypothetical protein VMV21_08075, partial [Vicinamibacteria bacterium]|nr:hypothetical protein [Vicinamibacteria bacterium]